MPEVGKKLKFVCIVCDNDAPCELTFAFDEGLDNEPFACPFSIETDANWISVDVAKKLAKYFGVSDV